MLQSSDNIRPLRDRVFVKELPWPNKSGGGIFLPDQGEKREEVWRAVVIAVGPGKPPIGLLRRALGLLAEKLDAPLESSSEWCDAAEGIMDDVRAGISVGFGADVKPGDVVLVSKYVHTKVRVGGEWCSIIAASDILGVVTDGGDQVGAVLQRALERHELNQGRDMPAPTVLDLLRDVRRMADEGRNRPYYDPATKEDGGTGWEVALEEIVERIDRELDPGPLPEPREAAERHAWLKAIWEAGDADVAAEKERRANGVPHAVCACGGNNWKTRGTITLMPGAPASGSVECKACGREYPAEHIVQRPNGGAG